MLACQLATPKVADAVNGTPPPFIPNAIVLSLSPDSLGKARRFFLIHIRQHKAELIAAEAPTRVFRPQFAAYDGPYRLQHFIARRMPELVVNLPEHVDIEQAQRHRRVFQAGAPQQVLARTGPEVLPVRKAGESIVVRLPG